ncbi:Nuclear envelope morphology protein 1 [Chytriomyces hyalinus]|nr:Nuclear envelope morphology protein 1 [Chytriomyces hyalinus]
MGTCMLDTLPSELWLHTLEYLDTSDLITCVHLSRRWRRVMFSDLLCTSLFGGVWLDPLSNTSHKSLLKHGLPALCVKKLLIPFVPEDVLSEDEMDETDVEMEKLSHPQTTFEFPNVSQIMITGAFISAEAVVRHLTPSVTHLDLSDCSASFRSPLQLELLQRINAAITTLTISSHLSQPMIPLLSSLSSISSLSILLIKRITDIEPIVATLPHLKHLSIARIRNVFHAHRFHLPETGLQELQTLKMLGMEAIFTEDMALFVRKMVASARNLKELCLGCNGSSSGYDPNRYRRRVLADTGSGCAAGAGGGGANSALVEVVSQLTREGLLDSKCLNSHQLNQVLGATNADRTGTTAARGNTAHSLTNAMNTNYNSSSAEETTSEFDPFDTEARTDSDSSAASTASQSKKLRRVRRKRVETGSQLASSTSENTSFFSFAGISEWFGYRKQHKQRVLRPLRQQKELPKKTLVLDLDETLVHSTSMGSRHHDHIIEVLVDKHVCLYYVYKRPGVDLFLKKVSEWYKVVIFTASMPEYADPVIDWLDKDRKLISRRYFRQSCTPHENGHFTKDLSIVEPDLSSVVLLDNSPVSFAVNPENAIPIETWTHDLNDEALFELLPFLDALRFADDVRSILGLRI